MMLHTNRHTHANFRLLQGYFLGFSHANVFTPKYQSMIVPVCEKKISNMVLNKFEYLVVISHSV